MTKQEMIREIAEKAHVTQGVANEVFDAFCDVIRDAMKDNDKITLPSIGSFSVKEVPERRGIIRLGDKAGQEYVVPAHSEPRFKVSKVFKDMLA